MKDLHNYILEKLDISNIKISQYFFGKPLNFSIILPYTIECIYYSSKDHTEYIHKKIEIHRIDKTGQNDPVFMEQYNFYDKDNNLICILSTEGVKNVFIRKIETNCKLYNINGEEYNDLGYIEVVDEDKIIKESTDNNFVIYSNLILLTPDEDKILILRRANYMKKFRSMWGFPGGHVDKKDKNNKEAAIRELKEETGIELTFNESYHMKEYEVIENEDKSKSYYYITTLETIPEVKLSKEHSAYEWYNYKSEKNHKWMPDVFQIIQKIID